MSTQTTSAMGGPGLSRSQDGRLIGGVCAGIARRFETEVVVIRIAFIASILIGGVGALLYALALVVVPRDGEEHAMITVPRRAGLGAAFALALVALGGSALIGIVNLLGAGKVGVAAYLIALGLAALWWRENMAEPSVSRASATAQRAVHDSP